MCCFFLILYCRAQSVLIQKGIREQQITSYQEAGFFCPLCSSGLTTKQDLLFCLWCNVFVGKEETFSQTFDSKALRHKFSARSTADIRAEAASQRALRVHSYSLLAGIATLAVLGVLLWAAFGVALAGK